MHFLQSSLHYFITRTHQLLTFSPLRIRNTFFIPSRLSHNFICIFSKALFTTSSRDPSDSLGFSVRLELEFSFSFESVFDLVFSSSFSLFRCVLLVGGSLEESESSSHSFYRHLLGLSSISWHHSLGFVRASRVKGKYLCFDSCFSLIRVSGFVLVLCFDSVLILSLFFHSAA
ncbi:hypothetical protein LR48_Vigan06g093100 [Vigna angularis]|uniref:Uncharacterized protein n=1 Tax=Phaseolus angularis TaxID=3914 RepID=A0A0L9URX2_PHAAN|nr:hypothetical protein LR48_Vigan06g093100 [Vigna angularis]